MKFQIIALLLTIGTVISANAHADQCSKLKKLESQLQRAETRRDEAWDSERALFQQYMQSFSNAFASMDTDSQGVAETVKATQELNDAVQDYNVNPSDANQARFTEKYFNLANVLVASASLGIVSSKRHIG